MAVSAANTNKTRLDRWYWGALPATIMGLSALAWLAVEVLPRALDMPFIGFAVFLVEAAVYVMIAGFMISLQAALVGVARRPRTRIIFAVLNWLLWVVVMWMLLASLKII